MEYSVHYIARHEIEEDLDKVSYAKKELENITKYMEGAEDAAKSVYAITVEEGIRGNTSVTKLM